MCVSRLPIENSRGVRNESMQFGHGAQVPRLWRHLVSSPLPVVAFSIFTVIFTVKVLDTRIGAGLRAIRPKAIFRDLSRSIDSNDGLSTPSTRVQTAAPPSSAIGYWLTSLFHSFFTVTMPTDLANGEFDRVDPKQPPSRSPQ